MLAYSTKVLTSVKYAFSLKEFAPMLRFKSQEADRTLALSQMLLMCWSHFRSSVMLTPRYLAVLSKLLTSCLTAVKKHWIRYYDTVYERDGINYFWSIKNSNDVLNKFKSKNFQASKLSTYDFATLYTTLPHHLIKD